MFSCRETWRRKTYFQTVYSRHWRQGIHSSKPRPYSSDNIKSGTWILGAQKTKGPQQYRSVMENTLSVSIMTCSSLRMHDFSFCQWNPICITFLLSLNIYIFRTLWRHGYSPVQWSHHVKVSTVVLKAEVPSQLPLNSLKCHTLRMFTLKILTANVSKARRNVCASIQQSI